MEQKKMSKNYISYRYKPNNELKRFPHYKYINLSPQQMTMNSYYIKNIKKVSKTKKEKEKNVTLLSLWKDIVKFFIKEFLF